MDPQTDSNPPHPLHAGEPSTTASTPQNEGPDEDSAATYERVAVAHVIACSAIDTLTLTAELEAYGARTQSFASPESWFDKQSRPFVDEDVADVVFVVSHPATLLQEGWIARARAAAPDSVIAAALVESTLCQAAAVVNQGAQGLISGFAPSELLQAQVRDVVAPAVRKQDYRREAAGHRRALASLTAAESDVLDLMLDGLANKQIAQRLAIGLRTVELRRSKIMRKMRASSVAQLISSVCTARYNGRL